MAGEVGTCLLLCIQHLAFYLSPSQKALAGILEAVTPPREQLVHMVTGPRLALLCRKVRPSAFEISEEHLRF